MYRFIKPFLFSFDPEKVHHLVVKFIQNAAKVPGFNRLLKTIYGFEHAKLERTVFGIHFKNPVGLGAGFDKNATIFHHFFSFGFSFIEIGTLTPKGQDGNEKPRMFRLPADGALINRMGFNNEGVAAAALRIAKFKKPGLVIGGNIGKNKATPNDEAKNDYAICFEVLYPVVDYFTVNVSSPNTPGLRELQDKQPLKELLEFLQALNLQKPVARPILLKIAPDLTNSQLDDIIEIVAETGIAGVVATNTTLSRANLVASASLSSQAGGLSGRPLRSRSTEVIEYLYKQSNAAFPIIGVGGIHSAEDAIEKLKAGASLIQIYTGFIYEGPGLVKRINKGILKWMQQQAN